MENEQQLDHEEKRGKVHEKRHVPRDRQLARGNFLATFWEKPISELVRNGKPLPGLEGLPENQEQTLGHYLSGGLVETFKDFKQAASAREASVVRPVLARYKELCPTTDNLWERNKDLLNWVPWEAFIAYGDKLVSQSKSPQADVIKEKIADVVAGEDYLPELRRLFPNKYPSKRTEIVLKHQNRDPKTQGILEAVSNSIDAISEREKIGQFGLGVKQVLGWLEEGQGDVRVVTKGHRNEVLAFNAKKGYDGQVYVKFDEPTDAERNEYADTTGTAITVSDIHIDGKKKQEIEDRMKERFRYVPETKISVNGEEVNGFSKVKVVGRTKPVVQKGMVDVTLANDKIVIRDTGLGMDRNMLFKMFLPGHGKGFQTVSEPKAVQIAKTQGELLLIGEDTPSIVFSRNRETEFSIPIPQERVHTFSKTICFELGRILKVSEGKEGFEIDKNFAAALPILVDKTLTDASLSEQEKIAFLNSLVLGIDQLSGVSEAGQEDETGARVRETKAAIKKVAVPFLKQVMQHETRLLPNYAIYEKVGNTDDGKENMFVDPFLLHGVADIPELLEKQGFERLVSKDGIVTLDRWRVLVAPLKEDGLDRTLFDLTSDTQTLVHVREQIDDLIPFIIDPEQRVAILSRKVWNAIESETDPVRKAYLQESVQMLLNEKVKTGYEEEDRDPRSIFVTDKPEVPEAAETTQGNLTKEEEKKLTVISAPLLQSVGNMLYMIDSSGLLKVIDMSSYTLQSSRLNTEMEGKLPVAMRVTDDGIWVLNYGEQGQLLLLDKQGNVKEQYDTPKIVKQLSWNDTNADDAIVGYEAFLSSQGRILSINRRRGADKFKVYDPQSKHMTDFHYIASRRTSAIKEIDDAYYLIQNKQIFKFEPDGTVSISPHMMLTHNNRNYSYSHDIFQFSGKMYILGISEDKGIGIFEVKENNMIRETEFVAGYNNADFLGKSVFVDPESGAIGVQDQDMKGLLLLKFTGDALHGEKVFTTDFINDGNEQTAQALTPLKELFGDEEMSYDSAVLALRERIRGRVLRDVSLPSTEIPASIHIARKELTSEESSAEHVKFWDAFAKSKLYQNMFPLLRHKIFKQIQGTDNYKEIFSYLEKIELPDGSDLNEVEAFNVEDSINKYLREQERQSAQNREPELKEGEVDIDVIFKDFRKWNGVWDGNFSGMMNYLNSALLETFKLKSLTRQELKLFISRLDADSAVDVSIAGPGALLRFMDAIGIDEYKDEYAQLPEYILRMPLDELQLLTSNMIHNRRLQRAEGKSVGEDPILSIALQLEDEKKRTKYLHTETVIDNYDTFGIELGGFERLVGKLGGLKNLDREEIERYLKSDKGKLLSEINYGLKALLEFMNTIGIATYKDEFSSLQDADFLSSEVSLRYQIDDLQENVGLIQADRARLHALENLLGAKEKYRREQDQKDLVDKARKDFAQLKNETEDPNNRATQLIGIMESTSFKEQFLPLWDSIKEKSEGQEELERMKMRFVRNSPLLVDLAGELSGEQLEVCFYSDNPQILLEQQEQVANVLEKVNTLKTMAQKEALVKTLELLTGGKTLEEREVVYKQLERVFGKARFKDDFIRVITNQKEKLGKAAATPEKLEITDPLRSYFLFLSNEAEMLRVVSTETEESAEQEFTNLLPENTPIELLAYYRLVDGLMTLEEMAQRIADEGGLASALELADLEKYRDVLKTSIHAQATEAGVDKRELLQNALYAIRKKGKDGGRIAVDFYLRQGAKLEYIEEIRDNGTGVKNPVAFIIPGVTDKEGGPEEGLGIFGSGFYKAFEFADSIEAKWLEQRENGLMEYKQVLEIIKDKDGIAQGAVVKSLKRKLFETGDATPGVETGTGILIVKSEENQLPELEAMVAKNTYMTMGALAVNPEISGKEISLDFINEEGEAVDVKVRVEDIHKYQVDGVGEIMIIKTPTLPSHIASGGLRMSHLSGTTSDYLRDVPEPLRQFFADEHLSVILPKELLLIKDRSKLEDEGRYIEPIRRTLATEAIRRTTQMLLQDMQHSFRGKLPEDMLSNERYYQLLTSSNGRRAFAVSEKISNGGILDAEDIALLQTEEVKTLVSVLVGVEQTVDGKKDSLLRRFQIIQQEAGNTRASTSLTTWLNVDPKETAETPQLNRVKQFMVQSTVGMSKDRESIRRIDSLLDLGRRPETVKTLQEVALPDQEKVLLEEYFHYLGISEVYFVKSSEMENSEGMFSGSRMYLNERLLIMEPRERLEIIHHESGHLFERRAEGQESGTFDSHQDTDRDFTHQQEGPFARYNKLSALISQHLLTS